MSDLKNWKNGADGHRFVASFSGGKDSVLALYKAMKVGEPVGLLVMLEEEGKTFSLPRNASRAHSSPSKINRVACLYGWFKLE